MTDLKNGKTYVELNSLDVKRLRNALRIAIRAYEKHCPNPVETIAIKNLDSRITYADGLSIMYDYKKGYFTT